MAEQNLAPTIELDNSERQPCEIWSRVMGYYRPTTYWNPGKQKEWEERVPFKEPTNI